MSKFLKISLIVVALFVEIGTGYLVSPQYSMAKYEGTQMADLGKPDKLRLRFAKI